MLLTLSKKYRNICKYRRCMDLINVLPNTRNFLNTKNVTNKYSQLNTHRPHLKEGMLIFEWFKSEILKL